MAEPWFIEYERAGKQRERYFAEWPKDYDQPPRRPAPDAPWLPYVEPGPTLIGPFGGEHPPLPPDAPRWRRILRGIFQFCNEAGYTLIGGR